MTVNDLPLCQAECNMNRDIGCKSITYCPGNRLCYQYSKEITKNDELIIFIYELQDSTILNKPSFTTEFTLDTNTTSKPAEI